MKRLLTTTAAAAALMLLPILSQAQEPRGVIAGGGPVDLWLEVTAGPNGEPILSANEFVLETGGYYRFNFVCPDPNIDDATGFHFEATGLIQNSHIRILSVGDIEFYMQGLTFRAIECDETGAARFSFHPMRSGVYDLYVRDHSDPPQEAFGLFIVERAE
jgi:hypothetical protein